MISLKAEPDRTAQFHPVLRRFIEFWFAFALGIGGLLGVSVATIAVSFTPLSQCIEEGNTWIIIASAIGGAGVISATWGLWRSLAIAKDLTSLDDRRLQRRTGDTT